MRRRWAAIVAVACLLALGGCADIPTSGDVRVGPTQDVKNQDVVLVPYQPAPGESPANIVQGFITAATGQQDDYKVARDFLTPALAKTWNPDARVLIHDQSWQVKTISDTSIVVTVPTTAEVDAEGVYSSLAAPKTVPVPFALTKINGQWRIAKTPDGIILGTNYFGSLFTGRPVSYFDSRWTQPVPDLRWFPARRVTPKRVVQALLAGPAAPIAPPVTATAFPPQTTVTSVRNAGGVATVDLDTGTDLPSVTALSRMRTQLKASLVNLAGIQEVQIAIDGQVEHPPLVPPPSGTGADPGALVLRGGIVGTLSGTTFHREPTLGPQIAAVKPLGGTIALSRRLAAIRTPAGVDLVTPGRARPADRRGNLVDPTLDPLGWTYSVPADQPRSWKAFDTRGRSVNVAVTMPELVSITAIEASRDGTRMLVLATSARGPLAFVVGIVRDGAGRPLALTGERYTVEVPTATTAIDATWVDTQGSSVAVLGQDEAGENVTEQQLGGLPSALGPLSGAGTLVGATGVNDLRALLQGGSIAELSGTVWMSEPTGSVDVLFVQR